MVSLTLVACAGSVVSGQGALDLALAQEQVAASTGDRPTVRRWLHLFGKQAREVQPQAVLVMCPLLEGLVSGQAMLPWRGFERTPLGQRCAGVVLTHLDRPPPVV